MANESKKESLMYEGWKKEIDPSEWNFKEDLVVQGGRGTGLPPDGVYHARYIGTKMVSNGDRSYLRHLWRIEDGEYSGFHVFQNTSLTLSETSKLGEIFKGTGISFKVGEVKNVSALVGRDAVLTLVRENVNGKDFIRVKAVLPRR